MVDHFQLLLDWTRPVDWLPGSRPIVWLSVAETAYRLGISTSQVRRNEAAMHRLGAIAWKDSPNHRRYGRLGDFNDDLREYGPDAFARGTPNRIVLDDLPAAARRTLRLHRRPSRGVPSRPGMTESLRNHASRLPRRAP